jgi:hypothetical protein
MKTNVIVLAATLGAVAVAALVLSFRSLDAESAVGYLSVLALVGMAGLEYRINWKRLFSR